MIRNLTQNLCERQRVRKILPEVLEAWQSGRPVGVATVIETWRSAPQPAGAAMLVTAQGEVAGSVSGGCVEGAVFEVASQVILDGVSVVERYGVSDQDAFAVGLTCGGIIDVFVERIDRETFPELGSVADDVAAGRPVAVATLVEHPDPTRVGRRVVLRPHGSVASGAKAAMSSSLGSERMDDAVATDARGALAAGLTKTLTYGPDGERLEAGARVFVSSYAPRPRMLIFGAIDFAQALSRMGSMLGYHTTVCDARAVFTTPNRFPEADEVVVDWPHRYLAAEVAAGRVDERTVIAVLTHDPKFDVPLLEIALRLPSIRYVGAMGSRRTHESRLMNLQEAGLTETELAKLSSPLGLDLGARTPEETAVSICAEIIALSSGGNGARLSGADGPIHHPVA